MIQELLLAFNRRQHLRQRLFIGQSMIVPDLDQRRLRQAAVPDEFNAVLQRYHIVGSEVQDRRVRFDGRGRSSLLPRGWQEGPDSKRGVQR